MDELLAGLCEPGDTLVTRRAVDPELLAALDEAGLRFTHHAVEGAAGAEGSVEELFARDPAAPTLLRDHRLAPYAVTDAVAALAVLPYAVTGAVAGAPAVLPYAVTDAPVATPPAATPYAATDARAATPPYAVTGAVAEQAVPSYTAIGAPTRLPDPRDAARVNSKTWSNDVVADLGLPGAGVVVRSTADLARAVADAGPVAVVKDPYGVSGRGALEVSSPGVLRAITRVLDRQVAAGARVELLVQRRFAKRHDLSAHGDLAPDGTWRRLGVRVVHNRGFRYAGSSPVDGSVARFEPALLEAAAEVARRAFAEGYHGPLSVDAMVLADGSLVPVLEVNARVSLGRLALRLDRVLGDGPVRCHLWQVELAAPPGMSVGRLLGVLRRAGLLHREGTGAGCVVLGGGVVAPPTARLHCVLLCAPEDLADLRTRLLAAFADAGLRPRGAVHAG
jgi:hypothetical protein